MTARGTVELWHPSCWAQRDVPIVVETAPFVEPIERPIEIRRRLSRIRIAGGFAGSAILAIVVAQQASARSPDADSMVSIDVVGDEDTALRASSSQREIVPPRPARASLDDDHPIPFGPHGKPMVEAFPTLAHWIHPITDAGELFPWNPARHFGALRHGVERPECGEGHCGVDLDGVRGRPLVAVAAGQIVHVERREKGADGRSGRYVRIEHEDGTFTSYMHMDEVEAELQLGDHVEQGQYIGTLGSTAVEMPHLHFALEIPHDGGTMFIDPAPYLVRAKIADVPERRHPVKPAF